MVMIDELPGDAPLGVFDSGLGGLTVVRALREVLPNESLVYLGDTARVPYGTRSADTVVKYARGCARILVKRGVKALVVACNTVSAVAIDILRAELDLPVVGVVEPGASAAIRAIDTLNVPRMDPPPRIGVLGTAGTIASGAYSRAVSNLSTRLEVVGQAAPLLVPLVEEGWVEGIVPELAVKKYVSPLIEQRARVLVLGCTHYPLLRTVIERVAAEMAGCAIPVVDGAAATAQFVSEYLQSGRIKPRCSSRPRSLELLVTDLPASFKLVAERFLGEPLPQITQIDI
jgi:glutamate racemase